MGDTIPSNDTFLSRITHLAYSHGIPKTERACQMAWDMGRGLMELRRITSWVNSWPGYPGGTKQWVRDSIADRRVIYVLSPNLKRWVTSYELWDKLSSSERAELVRWTLERDLVDPMIDHGSRQRMRLFHLQRDDAYQYMDLQTGELSIPCPKDQINPDDCISLIPNFVEEGHIVDNLDDNPNFQPDNQ